MIDLPHIPGSTASFSARIRLTVPREEIRQVMGPGISQVLGEAGTNFSEAAR